jgi:hypothetical protein
MKKHKNQLVVITTSALLNLCDSIIKSNLEKNPVKKRNLGKRSIKVAKNISRPTHHHKDVADKLLASS